MSTDAAADESAESAASSTDRLKARWAEPDAVAPPWYRRVPRRTWVRAGAAVAGLAVVGTLVAVLGPDDPTRYRVEVPQAVGELTRDPDAAGEYALMDQDLFPDLPGEARYREHFVAGYRLPDADRARYLVVASSGSFAGPVRELDELLGGTDPALGGSRPGPAYTVFDAGPLGGALKCTATEVPICAWADSMTIGSVTDLAQADGGDGGAPDLAALAERTRAVRAAATVRMES